MTKVKKLKFKSMSDLYRAAKDGNVQAKKMIIGGLNNLGADHLAKGHKRWHEEKWSAYYAGLQDYIGALVGEYGESESQAERGVLDEVNFVHDAVEDVSLEW